MSAVVTSAARSGLKVIARGTGHGALQVGSLSRAVLVRTTAFNEVEVEPRRAQSLGRVWRGVASGDSGCCRTRPRGPGRFGSRTSELLVSCSPAASVGWHAHEDSRLTM